MQQKIVATRQLLQPKQRERDGHADPQPQQQQQQQPQGELSQQRYRAQLRHPPVGQVDAHV